MSTTITFPRLRRASRELKSVRIYNPILEENIENEYVHLTDSLSPFSRFASEDMKMPANVVKREDEMNGIEYYHHLMG